MSAEIREIVRSLDPLPASLANGRFDILITNDAHEDLFQDWHSMPCVHRDSLWCCLTEPAARAKFPQYEREVRYLVARMPAAYARHVGDQEWEEDIRRLSGLSPEFAGLWARHEVAAAQPRTRTFIHPVAGPLTFTVTSCKSWSWPMPGRWCTPRRTTRHGPGCRSPGVLSALTIARRASPARHSPGQVS